ncbi:hypothetical protein [Sphingobacterium hungaricum]
MKSIIYLLGMFLSLSFFSCNKSDELNDLNLEELDGTWQLVYLDYGDEIYFGKVPLIEDGYIISFDGSGNFTSNQFDDCQKGTYEVEEGYITFTFDCPNSGNMLSSGIQKENYSFDDGFLYLSPTYKAYIEGCYSQFKKISD